MYSQDMILLCFVAQIIHRRTEGLHLCLHFISQKKQIDNNANKASNWDQQDHFG